MNPDDFQMAKRLLRKAFEEDSDLKQRHIDALSALIHDEMNLQGYRRSHRIASLILSRFLDSWT